MAKTSLLLRLAARVREERERQGLSQAQLASKAGMSRSQILAIERGERASSVLTLQTVATALGVPAGDLLSDQDLPNPRAETADRVAASLRRLPPEIGTAIEQVLSVLERTTVNVRRRRRVSD